MDKNKGTIIAKKTINYNIMQAKSGVDLAFSSVDSTSDRFFCYLITLMDITDVFDKLFKQTNPAVSKEYMNSITVLTSMTLAMRNKLEEEMNIKSGIDREFPRMDNNVVNEIKKKMGLHFPEFATKGGEDSDDIEI